MSGQQEAIAIIGLSCRVPGADNPDALWRMLCAGTDAIGPIPRDRFNAAEYYDAMPGAAGKIISNEGGFLDRIDGFDADFFDITSREARTMDPQQRLLLQVTWESFEDAGLPPLSLRDSMTGVFVASAYGDYEHLRFADPSRIDGFLGPGTLRSAISGRVATWFGLQGPTLSVDTGCSGALVAVHLACQSLQTKECDLAIAGGVNVILVPHQTIGWSHAENYSPAGRCKFGDDSADGFVRSEGVGVVVLKSLSAAVADGDPIRAVILGSAVNHTGRRSRSMVFPSQAAQVDVIHAAHRRAGIEPGMLHYLEAHGTGTRVGDAIELQALAKVLCEGRPAGSRCRIGSIKSNIGHTEAASGVVGLIKAALSLQHGVIPPTLHVKTPHPDIDWDDAPYELQLDLGRYPAGAEPRYAAVHSLGISATNSHVVMCSAPLSETRHSDGDRPVHILPISARTEAALRALRDRYREHLSRDSDVAFSDECFTAGCGRSHFEHRMAVVATDRNDAAVRLETSRETDEQSVIRGMCKPDEAARPRVAFMFTGQGSQYVGMAGELYDTQPTFRAALDECSELLRPHLAVPLLSVIYAVEPKDSPINETAFTQPALFAVEYALARLWQSWGIEPGVVLGHSVGEYVAACVAGVFSLADGLGLIAARGRLMQALPAGGAMAAIFAEEERVKDILAHGHDRVCLAALNGPAQTVISGEKEAVNTVLRVLKRASIDFHPLTVSHAFHSHLMDPMLAPFGVVASGVTYREPSIDIVSNVTGRRVEPGQLTRSTYWCEHVRSPVRFADSISGLLDDGYELFLEIGPHPVLSGMGASCDVRGRATWLPSLKRAQPAWPMMLESLGRLYVRGVDVDWKGFDRDYVRRKVSLPTYAFQEKRYWLDDTADQVHARPVEELTYELRWRVKWRPGDSISARALSDPSEVVGLLAERFEQVATDNGVAIYDSLLPVLERACADYARRALLACGWKPAVGEEFGSEAIAGRCGVVRRHRRLLDRLLAILGEEGELTGSDGGWRVERPPSDQAVDLTGLIRQSPECRAELALLDRCGSRLADVLRGGCDPLSLLFPQDDSVSAQTIYTDIAGTRTQNMMVAEAIRRTIKTLPEHRPIRVLEIGAGTGGTTAHALEVLPPGRTEYLFTDLTAGFFADAEERFNRYPFVSYRKLDIEHDPLEQGFEPHAFDLVIASNVLHATRDLGESLRHVRALLASHGVLMLVEMTHRQRWLDLTFGLLEGWWRFSDHERRPDGCLISASQWSELLQAEGFHEPAFLPTGGTPESRAPLPALILARGPEVQAETFPRAKPSSESNSPNHWIIIRDQGELSDALRQSLGGKTATCEVVHKVEEVEKALAFASANRRVSGIVDLMNLDAAMPGDLPPDDLLAHTERAAGRSLVLIQTLSRWSGDVPPLFIVTSGGQTIGTERTHPLQSLVWGLGRVADRELSRLDCRRVDLDPDAPIDDQVKALMAELLNPDDENQVVLRSALRYVPHLEPRAFQPPEGSREAAALEGTVLVTGGLGGLGLAAAQWLVQGGVRHLVLMARRKPGNAARRRISAMEKAGAVVKVVRCDTADRARLVESLRDIRASMPPMVGVYHAAGTLDDALLPQQNWDRFKHVLAAKLLGTWNLHTCTRDDPIRQFVLFSSVAAVLGTAGQANHASANTFLDGFAHYRRSLGLAATSINWGPWSEIGAAADADTLRVLKAIGISPIAPQQGLAALERIVASNMTQAAVIDIDWAHHVASYGHNRVPAIFRRRIRERDQGKPSSESTSSAPLLQKLAACEPGDRAWLIRAQVHQTIARVLGTSTAEIPDRRAGFFTLGIDSLMAVEIRNRLQRDVGREHPLSSTLAFDYPTVEALSNHLVERLVSSAPKVEVLSAPQEAAKEEPIAIVGVGCRFPGGVYNAESFWRLLREGLDGITEIPADRWDVDAYYDPDPDAPGKMNTRRGGFISDVDQFDPAFFGIAPREAVSMDPQQRLLLEVTWEALEDAGQPPHALIGSRSGVFIGMGTSDYAQMMLSRDPTEIDQYLGTGIAHSVVAGRVSYALGWQGPSMLVDTACSSGALAVHLACQSLHLGECGLAVAGAVNLILSPELTIHFSKTGMLAPDGRCKTFDASADGYARAEGCGVVVLKRLSDAQRANDRVLAVIRGSAVNQDGRSSGLTAPNGPSQESVIRAALASAGVEPCQIGYVEAHGTGTTLGDPIELQALGSVLRDGRSPDHAVQVGSVKTNLGHLEAAAGIAGLIKVALALRYREIPRQLHFSTPTPHVNWDQLPLSVVTDHRPWPPIDGRRLAGLSSFGFTGTNVHLVLEESAQQPAPTLSPAGPCVLPLSARTASALAALMRRYGDHLVGHAGLSLHDICYTAAVCRSHFEHRAAVVADDVRDLNTKLTEAVNGKRVEGVCFSGDPARSLFADVKAAPTLDRPDELAAIYVSGGDLDWPGLYRDRIGRKVSLPTYPFQHKRYWIESKRARTKSPGPSGESWSYELRWKPQPRPPRAGASTSRRWVVIGHEDVAGAFQRVMQAMAVSCECVTDTDSYLSSSARSDEPTDLVYIASTRQVARIGDSLGLQPGLVCLDLLHLVQGLLKRPAHEKPRLCIVTAGTQAVVGSGDMIDPATASLWGLARTVGLEHPELRPRMIDVDRDTFSAEDLAHELLADTAEDHVAYRGGHRFVARIEPAELSAPGDTIRLDGDAGYLITGGLGGLGLEVARWMADRGARRLVLMSRRSLPGAGEAISAEDAEMCHRVACVRSLEARGVRVECLSVDVSDRRQLAAALSTVSAEGVAIKGIVHAAGVAVRIPVGELTDDLFRDTWSAKAEGAWHLHELTRDWPLDFFVLFSSIAASWGSQDQSHYAAANQFLDSLAHHRRARGLPATSIAWGPWSGWGMADRHDVRTWLEAHGLRRMSSDRTTWFLGQAIAVGRPHTIIADINWAAFLPLLDAAGVKPLFEAQRGGMATVKASHASGTLRRSMLAADPDERSDMMTRHVRDQVAGVLGLDAEEVLDERRGLFDLGMDSMMAVQIKSRLESSLGCELPATVALEHPNIRALAEHLCEIIEPNGEHPEEHVDVLLSALSANYNVPDTAKELTDEQARAELLDELKQLGF